MQSLRLTLPICARLHHSGDLCQSCQFATHTSLSGDVVQWINPVTWFASGNQISTNVYLGESSSPETEAEILDRVGSYGRQLGQITDAMSVLLRHLPHRASLSPEESRAIEAFEKMANDIADIKEKHKRQAVRP